MTRVGNKPNEKPMGERECVGPEIGQCSVEKWVGRAQLGIFSPNPTNFLLLNPDFFFWRQRASAKGSARAFFGGGGFL
jgi:hypothetical protein